MSVEQWLGELGPWFAVFLCVVFAVAEFVPLYLRNRAQDRIAEGLPDNEARLKFWKDVLKRQRK